MEHQEIAQVTRVAMLEFLRDNDVWISKAETCRLIGVSPRKLFDMQLEADTKLIVKKGKAKTSKTEYLYSSILEERKRYYRVV